MSTAQNKVNRKTEKNIPRGTSECYFFKNQISSFHLTLFCVFLLRNQLLCSVTHPILPGEQLTKAGDLVFALLDTKLDFMLISV